jgi:3-deoxy-D-manno-octulosonic-acid transferase
MVRLSQWDGMETGVLLLDQMGVLASAYDYADAVFVGGSLVPFGGHNPVEPAYYEKAILFGPHMNNFKIMAKNFLNASAAIQVENAEALERELISLTESPERRKEMGRRAKSLIITHQGATERNRKLLMNSMALAE